MDLRSESIRVRSERTAVFLRSTAWLACLACLMMLASRGEVRSEDTAGLVRVVKEYFDAEMLGNTERVWALLAPSSDFKRAYSYPFYSHLAKRHPVRVKNYVIEGVLEIVNNPDRKRLPMVEKVALVRVRVVLTDPDGTDTGETKVFTFLQEGGAWYKG
ncbi:MAG: hypothetical protein RDU20_07340 [Desulfomonilaceae bacterium]|nr:hypothetical protein [Desulfomonilaceae bacterium]